MRFVAVIGALLVVGVAYLFLVARFTVQPDEQAAVFRLGAYHRTLGPGQLNFYFWPLENYDKESVTAAIDVEFGFRTVPGASPPQYEDKPEERRMITVDENLVNVEFVVRYRIGNLRDYLLNVEQPERAIRDVSAAVMRSVVATVPVDDVLKERKTEVEIAARDAIRAALDAYGVGVLVQSVQLQEVLPPDEVRDAFAAVTSAEQEGARFELEAQAYAEKVVPEARGEAERLVNEASAYRQSRILRAQGEADRFNSLYAEYVKAPEVTRQRLVIEMFEEILPKMDKVIMQEGQSEKVLPYLPIGRGTPR